MHTSDFDYNLPSELIAQIPTTPRDHSRLMLVDKKKKTIEHHNFYDIVEYLKKGDLIVWNNSKVFKARLLGKLLKSTGENLWEHKRDIEIFLIKPKENQGVWQVLAKPGRHVASGMRVSFGEDFYCDVMLKENDGTILVQFPDDEESVRQKANQYGHIPVPPYVKDEPHELESYQTVYAKSVGSVAAPTAGFHFTPDLIEKLKSKGVEFAEVTLHVGLGTFLPVKTERIEDHTMHSEWVELTDENAEKINLAKKEGRRVVAVGTTTVRTLEGIAMLHHFMDKRYAIGDNQKPSIFPYRGELNLFITPGFEFRVIDAMITNFHLPKSTLLMLVSAFAGDREFMLKCYEKAVEERYRFFSFGDAMLIV
ncbi:MAG: tRNA preQ1(34) S-adenosylmethionine ribosyltransferase-isomerase QueA [Candidatus Magasanikbacteria bacterium]|nr:tRNA preQ1(34) S-adenosylmethionine ribosyltransferase-isomerase QueA [Candidatus Magasanikbacteria bacterium]